jgi:hypothetical protein
MEQSNLKMQHDNSQHLIKLNNLEKQVVFHQDQTGFGQDA